MKTFTCPFCFQDHQEKDLKIRCDYSNDANPSRKCFDDSVKKDADGNIDAKDLKKCMRCPHGDISCSCPETGEPIHQCIRENGIFTIGMVGARNSGKSFYIASLIKVLRDKLKPFNCVVDTSIHEESEEELEDLYMAPFDGLRRLQATYAGVPKPILFSLKFLDKKGRVDHQFPVAIYDIAGEAFSYPEERLVGYLKHCSALIYCIAPKELDQEVNEWPIQAVANILQADSRKTIFTPTAFVLTKSDLIRDELPETVFCPDDSRYLTSGTLSERELNGVSEVVRQFILNALPDGWVLVSRIAQFNTKLFFAVSAMGEEAPTFNPRRVLDPFLWLIAKKAGIKITK